MAFIGRMGRGGQDELAGKSEIKGALRAISLKGKYVRLTLI